MSAVCGIVDFEGGAVDPRVLEGMIDASSMRGPNGTRRVRIEGAAFAFLAFHVTLSDRLSHLPIRMRDGSWLLADARIDNREELGELLGLRRNPDSDAALLEAAWLAWGATFVERLLGDFAVAVYQPDKRELLLASDPLGVRAIAWRRIGSTVYFASELAAVKRLPDVSNRIIEVNLVRAMTLSPLPEDDTLFEGIHFCPPAHCLAMSRAGNRVTRYWQPAPGRDSRFRDEASCLEALDECLDHCMASRLDTHLPVSMSLSGGLDSALVAGAAARLSGDGSIAAYSNVFEHCPECDESERIDRLTGLLGIRSHKIVSDSKWTFSTEIDWEAPDEHPWTNCYVQLPLSIGRAAGSGGPTLMLHGNFGDALFTAGWPALSDTLAAMDWRRLRHYLDDAGGRMNAGDELWRFGLRALLASRARPLLRRHRASAPVPALLGPRGQEILPRAREPISHEKASAEFYPLQRMKYRSYFDPSWARGSALSRGRLYNRFNVEPAYPLRDRRLVEMLWSMPPEVIGPPWSSRRLQTTLVSRLTDVSLFTGYRKANFNRLLGIGLLDREKETTADLVFRSRLVHDGWVDAAWLRREYESGPRWSQGGTLFANVIHLELWYRRATDR